MASPLLHAAWFLAIHGFCAALAGAANANADRASPPSLPRFASLKHPVANVRVGPGVKYPIRWIYRRKGLPVEIIAEFGNWRRIRGSDGSDGWINGMLLSSTRTALAGPWSEANIDLRSGPRNRSPVTARLQPKVLVRLHWCDRSWCSVSIPGRDLQGYIRQNKLWGVYPDEIIKARSIWRSLDNIM